MGDDWAAAKMGHYGIQEAPKRGKSLCDESQPVGHFPQEANTSKRHELADFTPGSRP